MPFFRARPYPPLRVLTWLALVCAFVPAGVQGQVSVTGTMPEDSLPGLKALLDSGVRLARSPTLLQQQISVLQAEARRDIDSAVRMPRVSASLSAAGSAASTLAGNAASSTSTGAFYDVNLSQPLYEFGAINARVNIGKLAAQIAEQNYAEASRTLIQSIRVQYLSVIARKMAVRNARQALEIADAQLALGKVDVEFGRLSSTTDLELSRRQVAQNVDSAQHNLDIGLRALARLAGVDSVPADQVPGEIPAPVRRPEAIDTLLSAFLGGGVDRSNQARIYELTIEQNELELLINQKRRLPKFGLSAGTGLSNNTQAVGSSVQQTAVYSGRVALTVNWLLYEGRETRGRIASAYQAKRASEENLRAYKSASAERAINLRQELALAGEGLEIAEIRLTNALSSRSSIEGYLREEDPRYNRDHLAAAIASQFGAEYNALSARNYYLGLWTEFVSLVGADPLAPTQTPPRRAE